MNKQKLIDAGIDYESGVHRFAGSPQIYEKYLVKYFDTNELSALRQALESGDYDAAFRAAHNMKGGAGNLSIVALFGKICELVDALRIGQRGDRPLILCGEAEALYETARQAVKENSDG